jgi:uncharacterized protein (UPF0332 family)
MTDENRRENIAIELARASELFGAAKALIAASFANDAVSRAYYAVFHLIRAALLSRGIEPKTHAGALRLLNTELTHKGHLPAFSKLVSGLQRSREAADYEAGITFTLEEAQSAVSDAERFQVAVLELLRREGWIK